MVKTRKRKTKNKKTKKLWKEGNIDLVSDTKVKRVLKKIKKLKKYDIKTELKLYVPASDQKSSGRCWLFSYLNILRLCAISHYKLDVTFSFSASYMMFWDKYEKSKYFLEQVSEYMESPVDSIDNFILFRSVVGDGGTWNMLRNLIEKYGVVPYEAMKESAHTINTNKLNQILKARLQTCAKEIREMPKTQHRAYIDKVMRKIKLFLERAIGVPPKKVSLGSFTGTPVNLFKRQIASISGQELDTKICLINVPHLKENQYYCIPELNNMKDGYPLLYFNCSLHTMKKAIMNQLHKKIPIWFGSDFGKYHVKKESLLNNNVYDFEKFMFSKKELSLSKQDSVPFYQTNINHAMVLLGYYYQKKDIADYYIIENSHNMKMKTMSYENDHGHLIMSRSWFEKYVVMAVINKENIPISMKENIIYLPKWTNLGELL